MSCRCRKMGKLKLLDYLTDAKKYGYNKIIIWNGRVFFCQISILTLRGERMTDKLMGCIANPVKCRLLLEIRSQGKTTAKHLADIYQDIPQATLYRHLKKMLSDGIIQVVEETQVRGTVEKTYALAHHIGDNMESMLENNSGELYMQYFMQYIFGFAKQFQEYCQSPDIDIKRDMTGFSLSSLFLEVAK